MDSVSMVGDNTDHKQKSFLSIGVLTDEVNLGNKKAQVGILAPE
jgi:hypothetical protein